MERLGAAKPQVVGFCKPPSCISWHHYGGTRRDEEWSPDLGDLFRVVSLVELKLVQFEPLSPVM